MDGVICSVPLRVDDISCPLLCFSFLSWCFPQSRSAPFFWWQWWWRNQTGAPGKLHLIELNQMFLGGWKKILSSCLWHILIFTASFVWNGLLFFIFSVLGSSLPKQVVCLGRNEKTKTLNRFYKIYWHFIHNAWSIIIHLPLQRIIKFSLDRCSLQEWKNDLH